MRNKTTAILITTLLLAGCGSNPPSAPATSASYTLLSASFFESEECSGSYMDIMDSTNFSLTLNDDLSYRYSFDDTTGTGNWADGTLLINGNNATFELDEVPENEQFCLDDFNLDEASCVDSGLAWISDIITVNMITLDSTLFSSLYSMETTAYQCSNPETSIEIDENENMQESIRMYEDGSWVMPISGYCEDYPDNNQTLEECQGVNGTWVTTQTGVWSHEGMSITIDDTIFSLNYNEDTNELMILDDDGDDECTEIQFLLIEEEFEVDADCTQLLLNK